MRRLFFIFVLATSSCILWAEQPALSQANRGPTDVQAEQSSGSGASVSSAQDGGAQAQEKDGDGNKPGALKRLKRHLRNQVSSGCVQPIGACWDKPPQDEAAQEQPQQTADAQKGRPPRSSSSDTGESSSKNTKIDLSPPPGEAAAPGVGTNGEAGDVQEFKPWDPHKADKNVEVGDFYFKRGNYHAAESRYKEALYWKDNHALAMFRLAQAQEKLGEFADARKNYSGYLSILPGGEFAAEAKASLDRLKSKASQAETKGSHQ